MKGCQCNMMRRLLLLVVLAVLCVETRSQQVAYEPADSVLICNLLQQSKQLKPTENVPLFFARQFLNVPYVAHTLERFSRERLIVNTRQLDCTTLVETVTALTLCSCRQQYTFAAYTQQLQALRYRDGKLTDYTSRLHYFSDWIDNNTQQHFVKEVQSSHPPFTAVQRLQINYMSLHPQSYDALKQHPAFVSVIKKHENALTGRTYRYIPKSAVKNTALLRRTVKDGDIIAITCNKKGLDIAHLGFAVWKRDGLHMLNASQLHKKVVTEPMTLYQYLQKHPSHTGIRIIRINQSKD